MNLERRALKETREIRFICFTTVQTMLGKHTATIIDMMTNFVLFCFIRETSVAVVSVEDVEKEYASFLVKVI